MRKVLGYFLIVFGGFMILVFLIVIPLAIYTPELRGVNFGNPFAIIGNMAMFTLFVLMVRRGLKLTGRLKSKSIRKLTESDTIRFEAPVTITFQLDFKTYFFVMYRNSRLAFALPFFFVSGVLLLSYPTLLDQFETAIEPQGWFEYTMAIGLGLCSVPFALIFVMRRSFKSNVNLQRQITYTFENDQVKIKGETFDSTLKANSYYQIRETKTAIMLYQSRASVNLILKSSFESKEDMNVVLRAFHIPVK